MGRGQWELGIEKGEKKGRYMVARYTFLGGGLGWADLLLVITRDSYIISSSSFCGGGGKGGEGNGCIGDLQRGVSLSGGREYGMYVGSIVVVGLMWFTVG